MKEYKYNFLLAGLVLGLTILSIVFQFATLKAMVIERRGDKYCIEGHVKKCLNAYRGALMTQPRNLTLSIKLARIEYQEGLFRCSLKTIRKANYYFTSPDLELISAFNYTQMSLYDSALFHFERLHYISPSKIRPLYQMVLIHNKLGNYNVVDSITQVILNRPMKVPTAEAIRILEELKYLQRTK